MLSTRSRSIIHREPKGDLQKRKNLYMLNSSHLRFSSHLKFNSFDLMGNDGHVCSVASLAFKHLHKKNSLISRYCSSYSNHKTSLTKETIIEQLMSNAAF